MDCSLIEGGTVEWWLAPLPQEGSRFFLCGVCMLLCVWFLSGYSGFLPQYKDMQIGLGLGDSRLIVAVNVRVNMSLYVGPVLCWLPVQDEPYLSPIVSWDWLQLPL